MEVTTLNAYRDLCHEIAGRTPERFFDKVIPEPMSGCHLWIGAMTTRGYGSFAVDGRPEKAHRVAWALAHGGHTPDGWVLHRCDNPSCVNPMHLYVGTPKDNARDMVVRGRARNGRPERTHCPKGHVYDERNTYLDADGGRRVCRACRSARERDWNGRHRERRHEINAASYRRRKARTECV